MLQPPDDKRDILKPKPPKDEKDDKKDDDEDDDEPVDPHTNPDAIRIFPVHVYKMPGKVIDIACGESIQAAILEDGSLVTWGMVSSCHCSLVVIFVFPAFLTMHLLSRFVSGT